MWILRLRFWFWLERKHPKLFRKLNREIGYDEEKHEKLRQARFVITVITLVLQTCLLVLIILRAKGS